MAQSTQYLIPASVYTTYLHLQYVYDDLTDSTGRVFQPILLEMDSLIAQMEEEEREQSKCKVDKQIYRIIYRIEQYLLSLQSGRTVICIYFNSTLHFLTPAQILLRQCTITHLTQHAEKYVTVRVFEHSVHMLADFLQYCNDIHPAFLLITTLKPSQAAETMEGKQNGPDQWFACLSLILLYMFTASAFPIPIVRTRELLLHHSCLRGYKMNWNEQQSNLRQIENEVRRWNEYTNRMLSPQHSLAVTVPLQSSIHHFWSLFTTQCADIKPFICTHDFVLYMCALAEMFEKKVSSSNLPIFIPSLFLSLMWQHIGTPTLWNENGQMEQSEEEKLQLDVFVDSFFQYLSSTLSILSTSSSIPPYSISFDVTICDLYNDTVMRYVVANFRKAIVSLPENMRRALNVLWNLLLSASPALSSLFVSPSPFDVHVTSVEDTDENKQSHEQSKAYSEAARFAPFTTFVDDSLIHLSPSLIMVEEWLHSDSSSSCHAAALPRAVQHEQQNHIPADQFVENRHWHSGRFMDDDFVHRPKKQSHATHTDWHLRSKAKYATWLEQYAQGLNIKRKRHWRDIHHSSSNSTPEQVKEWHRHVQQLVEWRPAEPQEEEDNENLHAKVTENKFADKTTAAKRKPKAPKPGSKKAQQLQGHEVATWQEKSGKIGKEEKRSEHGKAAELRAANQERMNEQLGHLDRFNAHCSTQADRIALLDEYVSEHYDAPSQAAFLAIMKLLEWRMAMLSSANSSAYVHTEFYDAVALIYQCLCDLARHCVLYMKQEHMQQIQRYCHELGMQAFWKQLLHQWIYQCYIASSSTAKPALQHQVQGLLSTFNPAMSSPATRDIRMSLARFQLLYYGDLMLRSMKSAKDVRVKDFYPDAWQRRLLDIMDRNESALVVGPTSAGKTFISFYAMERVHSWNEQNPSSRARKMLVYVSPTKALVNQVAGEVYKRLGKTPAIFTREQRPDATNYDVLVTVPECLDILFTSPTRYEWTQHVAYIIFDEVHCIEDRDGSVWERLLLGVSCPIIANSATIGGIQQFYQWLKLIHPHSIHVISDKASHTNTHVQHDERLIRYANLEHYVYMAHQPASHTKEHNDKGNISKRAKKPKQGANSSQSYCSAGSVTSSSSSSSSSSSISSRCSADTPHGSFIHIHPAATLANLSLEEAFGVNKHCRAPAQQLCDISPVLNSLSMTSRDCLVLYELFDPIVKQKFAWADQPCSSSTTSHEPDSFWQLQTDMYHSWQFLTQSYSSLHVDGRFGNCEISRLQLLEYEHTLKRWWCSIRQFVVQYQHLLTTVLQLTIQHADANQRHADCAAVSSYLESLNVLQQLLDNMLLQPPLGISANLEPLCESDGKSHSNLPAAALQLLLGLKSLNFLPAIVFHLNRAGCERLALSLSGNLKRMNDKFRSSPSYREQIKHKQDKLLSAEQVLHLQKRLEVLRSDHPSSSAPTAEMIQIENQLADQRALRWRPAFDDDYSFISYSESYHACEHEEDYWMKRLLLKTGWPLDHPLLKALERGIAVHHGGLLKPYRDLVEILFRQGRIMVIIATGTLAMGLNMPCRTAVFYGASPHLTPVSYRQMSGRAGRRGYDVVGRVVFLGIPVAVVTALMGAPLRPLKGHTLMTPSTVLRFIVKHQHPSNERNTQLQLSTRQTLKKMLSQSLSLVVAEANHNAAATPNTEEAHYRVSVELGYRFGLIDLHMQPIGLCGLACHLFYHEPANFAFVYLLQSGELFQLCEQEIQSKDVKCAADALMIVCCHLFSIRPLPDWQTREYFKPQPNSIVLLPKLQDISQPVWRRLKEYNRLVMNTYREYVRVLQQHSAVTHLNFSNVSNTLPLSNLSASPAMAEDGSLAQAFINVYQKQCSNGRYQQLMDEHVSVEVFRRLLPPRLFDHLHVPLLPHLSLADSSSPHHINAYAHDFYKHGIYQSIVNVNNIPDSQCYHILEDWNSLLRKIDTSLHTLALDANNPVLRAAKYLSEEFNNKFIGFKSNSGMD